MSVERLRELHGAATPAPWEWEHYGGNHAALNWVTETRDVSGGVLFHAAHWSLDSADAELIATARNLLPDLLALYDAAHDWVKQRDSVHKGYDVPASIREALARLDGASDG